MHPVCILLDADGNFTILAEFPRAIAVAAEWKEAHTISLSCTQALGFLQADKAQAVFYGLQVSQQDINEGFVVSAFSPTGSRIKLLLFESSGASSWELQEQVYTAYSLFMHRQLLPLLGEFV